MLIAVSGCQRDEPPAAESEQMTSSEPEVDSIEAEGADTKATSDLNALLERAIDDVEAEERKPPAGEKPGPSTGPKSNSTGDGPSRAPATDGK